MIYADYNATAPLRPEARNSMLEAIEINANPSSVHTPGRAARKQIEMARRQLGACIGARPQDIIFTSGGTEANALALQGMVSALEAKCTLLVSTIEHEAVMKNAAHSGVRVEPAHVTEDGVLDLDSLAKRLKGWDQSAHGIPVLALMLANNETGILQPVAEAAQIMRQAGGLIHCDGVQGLGKIPVNVGLLGVDYLALSAHKIGGPHGVGALWWRSGAPLKPVIYGGGQERALRSGTENIAGIAGFGAAAEAAVRDIGMLDSLRYGRDAMEARLLAAGVTLFGRDQARLAQTSYFALPGFRAETQIMALDLAGVAVSSGAACSSGKVNRSVVLAAMGVEDMLASCAVRVSFGWNSSLQDCDAVARIWVEIAQRAGHI